MAFVRWRGNCAELLTTVYENGKSRQILLANIPQDYAAGWVREQVATNHPNIRVDWLAVERVLSRGPKANPHPEPPLPLLQTEDLLRTIAQRFLGDGIDAWEAKRLNDAADILSSLHADPRLASLCPDNPRKDNPSEDATMSSDDTNHTAATSHGAASPARPEHAGVSSDDSARPHPPPVGRAGNGTEPRPQAGAANLKPVLSPSCPGCQQGARDGCRTSASAGSRPEPPSWSGPFFFGMSVRTFPERVAILIGMRT